MLAMLLQGPGGLVFPPCLVILHNVAVSLWFFIAILLTLRSAQQWAWHLTFPQSGKTHCFSKIFWFSFILENVFRIQILVGDTWDTHVHSVKKQTSWIIVIHDWPHILIFLQSKWVISNHYRNGKKNKQENKSIKYIKQIESICFWALGEPKGKKMLNRYFWGSSLLRYTNFCQIIEYDISCWNLSEFMFKIKGSDFPLRVLVACCY